MTLELKPVKGIYVDKDQRMWVAIDSVEYNGQLRKGVLQTVLIGTSQCNKITSGFELPEEDAPEASVAVNLALDMDTLRKGIHAEIEALNEHVKETVEGLLADKIKAVKSEAVEIEGPDTTELVKEALQDPKVVDQIKKIVRSTRAKKSK